MSHKCFISFKTENKDYKIHIQNELDIDMIDKSLDEAIDSEEPNYIMQQIRKDYLADSTITIHLIGAHSSENKGYEEQKFIKRELQASLYNGTNNTRNGILGVVLPEIQADVFKESYICSMCGSSHTHIGINDNTTVKEFICNYWIPNDKCSHAEDDRYCVLVKWEDFCKTPEVYIDRAFDKRSHPIAEKVTVYPK